MKLLELSMQGFLSHRDTTIDFSDLTYLSICGANGAGKSSIRQAISWAKYGTTRVTSNSDSVVNEDSDRAIVELTGQVEDGSIIKIVRSRGWNASGSVRVFDLIDGEWIAYGDHLNSTAQNRINDLLGISEDAYYSLSVIESSAGSRFVLAGSTERRGILLGLIPELSDWPVMLEKAKTAGAQVEKLMESGVNKLERTKELVEQGEESLSALEIKLAELKDDAPESEDFDALLESISQKIGSASTAKQLILSRLQEEKSKLDLDLNQFDSQIDKLEERLNNDKAVVRRMDKVTKAIKEIQGSLEDAEEKLSDLPEAESFEQRIAELTANETRLNDKIASAQADISLYSSKLKDAQEHKELLEEIDDETGVCYVCKSELSEEVHQNLIDSTNENFEDYTKKLKSARASKKKAQENLDDVTAEIRGLRQEERRHNDRLSDAKNKVASLKADLKRERFNLAELEEEVLTKEQRTEITDKIAELDDEATERESVYNTKTLPKLQKELNKLEGDDEVDAMVQERRDIQERKDAFTSHQQREEALKTRIAESKSNLKKLSRDIKRYEDDAEPLRLKLEDIQYIQKALSPKGVPSMLLDSILASIEDRQNEILSSIPGAEWMKVEFSQARDLKNGGKRDVLDILVHTASGKTRSIESFSSGERVKLTISNIFAMAQVFNERRPGTVDYLFLDEPLGVLDADSVPAFIDVLRSVMNKGIVSGIYIVAHDQRVIDALPQTLTVEKVDGSSRVLIS